MVADEASGVSRALIVLTFQPGRDALHHIFIKRSITAVCDISEVWSHQHIFQASKGMLGRQWFLIEHIDRRSGNCMRAKGRDEGWLIDDRAARRIDQSCRRFHQRKLSRSDKAPGAGAQDEMDREDVRFTE